MTNCHRHLVSKIIVFAYCPKMRTHNQLSNKIVSILSQEDQEGLGTFFKDFHSHSNWHTLVAANHFKVKSSLLAVIGVEKRLS